MKINIGLKRKLSLTLLLALSCIQLFAQPGIPGGDDCDPDDPDSCPVPLDDWLIVLVAASLILATWYLYNKQKKEAIA